MRQFGEVPPWLSTAAAPAVSAASGLGTGGGAGVQTTDGQGFGEVRIVTGNNPSAGGSVTLTFPQQPPVLFLAGDEGFGALSAPNNDGAHITFVISWATTLPPNRRLRIHYEWNVSK
jgi:hypothetical protein